MLSNSHPHQRLFTPTSTRPWIQVSQPFNRSSIIPLNPQADIDSVLALKDIPGYKTTKAAAASVRRSHQRAADASSARASSGPVPVMMMIGSRRSTHSDSGSHTGANSALGYHPSSSVGGGHSANPTPMHYGVRHGLGKARSSITRMPPAVDEPGPRGVSSIQVCVRAGFVLNMQTSGFHAALESDAKPLTEKGGPVWEPK